ncbi:MAG: hypothetical protein ACRDPY_22145 [Streptosporangiaceae bacterium]
MTSTEAVYAWRGADRRGGGRCGQATFAPGELPVQVETWFRQRWQWLVVTRDGLEVARIGRDDRTHKRYWYAEANR